MLCAAIGFLLQILPKGDGDVVIRQNADRSCWIGTLGGKKIWEVPASFMNDELLYDLASREWFFFSDEGDAVIVDKGGTINAKIPVHGVGAVRNCLVNHGRALFNEGARPPGLWKHGEQIVRWLLDSRDVRCIDLKKRRTAWKKPELDVGYPIYLSKHTALTLGIDNYWQSLGAVGTPSVSFRLVRLKDGKILKRSALHLDSGEADFLQEEIAVYRGRYAPRITATGSALTVSGLMPSDVWEKGFERLKERRMKVPFSVY